MTLTIRSANVDDIGAIVDLLVEDAQQRSNANPDLWKLVGSHADKIRSSVKAAMENENPPFRQQWLLATDGEDIVGVVYSILLPVPPIYAGKFGPPGLIMEDSFIAPDAPSGTAQALLQAAETDLRDAGATIFLTSSVDGGEWAAEFAGHGYAPLTLYFAKSGLRRTDMFSPVRPANTEDVPGIVASSAMNRQILHNLHRTFWEPHSDADQRFGAWMERSLTLKDRDMFVSGPVGDVQGYAISQPATPLHFPAPHDISGTGVIDDFYHASLENPGATGSDLDEAQALFQAAEGARADRGDTSVLVVCPAAWCSKIKLLKKAGYRNAITWFIKIAKA